MEDPTGARPLPGVPALLADLGRPFALVAVVSGRPTAFLGEMLGEPAGVTLAGLYGLEASWGPRDAAVGGRHRPGRGRGRAEAPAGIYVEPKGLTVTLHWRHAPDRRDWVLAFAERQHARHGLTVHPGRAERELRPPIDVDKGTVVRALAAEHAGQLRAVAVFGDDIGDLPAFAAVGELTAPDGRPLAAVRVAAVDVESPPEVAARADLTVRGAEGAVELLRCWRRRNRRCGSASVLSGRCQLVRPPVGRRPGAHGLPQVARPPGPLRRRHLESRVEGIGRPRDVEGVHAERPATGQELLPRAGLVREHEHPVGPVEERALLGHQVEPVAHRVHQQDVREGAARPANGPGRPRRRGGSASSPPAQAWLIRSAVCTTSAP